VCNFRPQLFAKVCPFLVGFSVCNASLTIALWGDVVMCLGLIAKCLVVQLNSHQLVVFFALFTMPLPTAGVSARDFGGH